MQQIRKMVAGTTVADGHQHVVFEDDGGSLTTSAQTAEGGAGPHVHGVVHNTDGTVTILASDGHTHEAISVDAASKLAKSVTVKKTVEVAPVAEREEHAAEKRLALSAIANKLKREDLAAARDLAERIAKGNPEAREAANEWLATHPPEPVVKTVEPVAKSMPTEIAKQRESFVVKAERLLDAGLEAFAKSISKTPVAATYDYLQTDEGGRLYAIVCEARKQLTDGDVESELAAINEQVTSLMAELEALVEAYALQHDLDRGAAEKRLQANSTAYATKHAKVAELLRERSTAPERVAREAGAARAALKRARDTEARKRADAEALASQSPAERALHDRITQLASERGTTYEKAFAWAVMKNHHGADNDPVAADAYRRVHMENQARQMGGGR